jgi:enterochelin esterase-like enzyme
LAATPSTLYKLDSGRWVVLSLTGIPLLIAAVLFAAAAPVLLAWWWRRKTKTGWLSALRPLAAVLACQLLAISALFIWVNNQYGFYTSWSDLFGVRTDRATIQSNGLVQPGAGRIQVLTVPGHTPADHSRKVLVWLPPQYDQPQFRSTVFPVLMVLPGQPSTPQVMFRHYDFGKIATTAIDAGRVKPFIAVFPPLMTNPPRDTECTNIPGGPQAYTWLSSMVPDAIRHQVRAQPGPWSLAGWSTGAFCATKLLLTQPKDFQAAVSLGGYFTPITDRTTGDLFHGDAAARRRNSPLWLYQQHGLNGRKLLLICGRQDKESWPANRQMLAASRGDPGVSFLDFPTGGHNYRNYRRYLPDALQWLDQVHLAQ